MSSSDRQNRLLVAEDWKRIYQTFRSADFQSYDFDTLRRTMILYLRENYPEDFNDYIESSEYLALIDLIAYLGQNLSFRMDLNARENFLELAERRESVLRLARLLSYNPRRNQCANGFLKIDSVSTSEDVFDSNNKNLSNQTIVWNDASNTNWYEQFIKIINAALPSSSKFGKPVSKATVSGIPSEQYKINSTDTRIPVYNFTKQVSSRSLAFEITSAKIDNSKIIEESPIPGNNLGFIYRDDGQGAGSTNTGFFLHFRQGKLQTGDFSVTVPTTNQVIGVNATDINNDDVWLYELDSNGNETTEWVPVPAVEGNNIVYNSLDKSQRKIYNVLTKNNDAIDLIFSDGVFGDLPKGNFRIYYRTSANSDYAIKPSSITNVLISVPYISGTGSNESLKIIASLKYTVTNATSTESNDSIKANAPATYYTQNRLITAEDYNIGPLAVSQDIVKVKSVNRIASGISRFYDLVDSTGKYSNTNLFADDGVIFKRYNTEKINFTFENTTDIENIVFNTIVPIIKDRRVLNFYYDKFPSIVVNDLSLAWNQVTEDTNRSTGYFSDNDNLIYKLGTYTGSNLLYVEAGALLKFVAPANKCFDKYNDIQNRLPTQKGDKTYIWAKVISVTNDGTANGLGTLDTGLGPVTLNDLIPQDAILSEIRPKYTVEIIDDTVNRIVNLSFAYRTFGLRYDSVNRRWRVILDSNLDVINEFSLGKAGDVTNQNQDASWVMLFETNGETYTVTTRNLEYIFESKKQIRFYFEEKNKVYDNKTGKIVKDRISILGINTQPDLTSSFTKDWDWQITQNYRDPEGYIDSKKIQVSFYDSDDDGVIDDPDLFTNIVAPLANPTNKVVFAQKYITLDGVEDFRYISKDELGVKVYSTENEYNSIASSLKTNGELVYFTQPNVFKIFNSVTNRTSLTADYRAYVGRDDLKFQYVHSADDSARIDPSSSNIIDTYMLTRSYDTEIRRWLNDEIVSKPKPPSSDELYYNYDANISSIKSISDEIIYHPVKYKILFGNKAPVDLQSTFKVVKNQEQVINDNQLKSLVVSAINEYFAIDNWDFGETFYFSELAAYITTRTAPYISSIVIVPNAATSAYGSLQEIRCESDEIFITGATVNNIEIITSLTASKLQASGTVVTTDNTNETGIQSSTLTITNNIGGYTY